MDTQQTIKEEEFQLDPNILKNFNCTDTYTCLSNQNNRKDAILIYGNGRSKELNKMIEYMQVKQIPFEDDLMDAFPPGAGAPAEAGWIIAMVLVIQFIIFMASLFGIYKLWTAIINFISDSSDSKIKHLLTALGSGEVSYSKTKIMGTGLLGTVLILAVTVAAMWVIGNVTIY